SAPCGCRSRPSMSGTPWSGSQPRWRRDSPDAASGKHFCLSCTLLVEPAARDRLVEMPGQELDGPRVGVQPVGRLGQAVALVGIDHELALDAAGPQRGFDLLSLAEGHPRVVGAVDDEQRRANVADARQRGCLLEELAVVGQAAVLALAV